MNYRIVFAGNNDNGKYTFRNLIIDRLEISVNVDPHAQQILPPKCSNPRFFGYIIRLQNRSTCL